MAWPVLYPTQTLVGNPAQPPPPPAPEPSKVVDAIGIALILGGGLLLYTIVNLK